MVRRADEGEKLTTLDDVVRPLDVEDLVITDRTGPIGLAGVMGGASNELSDRHRDVVIEAAHFDAMTLARTSRRHQLSTEASRRFERGVDPAAAYAAAHRVAELLVELAGGTLLAEETVRGSVLPQPTTTMAATLPATVLGTAVDRDTVVRLLTAIGATVTGEDVLTLTAPSWRPDLTDPYDYVEEVGRLVGFDTIPPVVPAAPPGRGLSRAQRTRRAVTAALATAGFVEVLSFSFASVEDLDKMGVPAGDERRRLNKIVNPLSETAPYLRTSLLPGLFAAVARNRSRGTEDLALFEAGSVFFARDPLRSAPRPPVTGRPAPDELAAMDDALGRQPRHLAAVLCGQRRGGWLVDAEPVRWTDAVAFVETAAATVGLALERRAATRAPWHPGRCAEFVADDRVLGYAGELHPEVCRAFDLPTRTVAAEIDLDALIAAAPATGDDSVGLGLPRGEGGRCAGRGRRRAGGRGGTCAAGRRRTVAGVVDLVRCVHRSAGAAQARLARVRAPLPRSGPDPHRRRDGGGAGRRRGRGRGADRRRPAHTVEPVRFRTARSSRRWRGRRSARRGR